MINGMTLNNIPFADNVPVDLTADTEVNLQHLRDRVDGSSKRMGLRINTGKTLTVGKQHEDIQIKLGGEVLEQVTKFVYLGGTLTEDGRCKKDIRRRKEKRKKKLLLFSYRRNLLVPKINGIGVINGS